MAGNDSSAGELEHERIPPAAVVATTNQPVTVRHCSVSERHDYTQRQCETQQKQQQAAKTTSKAARLKATKNMFVDEKHQVLLCVPYKSGASTHLNLLAQNSDAVLNHKIPAQQLQLILDKLVVRANRQKVGIRDMNSYPAQKRQNLLNNYYKVAVVRHPLVRILSMYTNKVAHYDSETSLWVCSDNYYGEYLKQYIVANQLQSTVNCSFALFVDYLVNHQLSMLKDMHTSPMTSWCNHCDINYDLIIKLETGNQDQRYLLDTKINPSFNKTLQINPALHHINAANNTQQEFTRVWTQFQSVNRDHFEKLIAMYRTDLDLFGYSYSWRDDGLETKCEIDVEGEFCC